VSLRVCIALILAIAKTVLRLATRQFMYVMLVFEMLEFMRALIAIVCGAQIVAPPERSPSVNMFVSVGVYFYIKAMDLERKRKDTSDFLRIPLVGGGDLGGFFSMQ
jgi:hypothetical protein